MLFKIIHNINYHERLYKVYNTAVKIDLSKLTIDDINHKKLEYKSPILLGLKGIDRTDLILHLRMILYTHTPSASILMATRKKSIITNLLDW